MKRFFLLIFLAIFTVCVASAKGDNDGVYVMGASISFSDSTVYFSEVQWIDSVALEKRTKFLPQRQHYSNEMQEYMLVQEGKTRCACIVLFAKSENKIRKKEQNLKRHLQKNRKFQVRYLGDKFKFTHP